MPPVSYDAGVPSAEILSYTAHTGRLGELGPEKVVLLRHRLRDGGGQAVEGTSEIYFSDRFAAHGGYTVTAGETHTRAHLPEDEYRHWIDLLRHEDPVYLHWFADNGEPDTGGIIHLATGPEPPGEGPVDLSP